MQTLWAMAMLAAAAAATSTLSSEGFAGWSRGYT
jgi:hypothetical protein